MTLLATLKKLPWWVDIVWIVALGLGVQAFWMMRLDHPTNIMDAYYYTVNGQQLAQGAGWQEPFIWQFLDAPTQLPTPSHTYWMPLPSLLAALGWALTGTFRGAQIPFWLLAGTLPLLSWAISLTLAPDARWQARIAAALTASGGFYAQFWVQPESFAPFAWTAGGCLLLLAWATTSERRWYWLGAGLLAGLAHLTRADGILLVAVGVVIWGVTAPRRRADLVLFGAGYLVTMGWWLGRSWLLTGRPLATVGTQTIFLTTYNDLFAYGRSFDWSHLRAAGWATILQWRWQGISVAIQTFIGVVGLIFLTPFMVWGGWRQGVWHPLLRPLTLYTVALFGVMSVVFTFPGMQGGLFHSTTAIWPWFMALTPMGVSASVSAVARRLPHWQPEKAQRLFSLMFVMVVMALSFGLGLSRDLGGDQADIYATIGDLLPADGVVLVNDPPKFFYHTGRMAVSIPNEPIEVMLEVAHTFGAHYLVLDRHFPQPLAAIYAGSIHDGLVLRQSYFLVEGAETSEIQLYEIVAKSSP